MNPLQNAIGTLQTNMLAFCGYAIIDVLTACVGVLLLCWTAYSFKWIQKVLAETGGIGGHNPVPQRLDGDRDPYNTMELGNGWEGGNGSNARPRSTAYDEETERKRRAAMVRRTS